MDLASPVPTGGICWQNNTGMTLALGRLGCGRDRTPALVERPVLEALSPTAAVSAFALRAKLEPLPLIDSVFFGDDGAHSESHAGGTLCSCFGRCFVGG